METSQNPIAEELYCDRLAEQIASALAPVFRSADLDEAELRPALKLAARVGFMNALSGAMSTVSMFDWDDPAVRDKLRQDIGRVARDGILWEGEEGPLAA